MNVYLSSSWKNRVQVRFLADELRKHGHEVYDFTDPACRKMPEIPPERFPVQWDPEIGSYGDYLTGVPEWRQAVECNRAALDRCDVIVLLLPCGADAHSDWAYGVGRGKRSCVVGCPPKGERTPTHLWADTILDDAREVLGWIAEVKAGRIGPWEREG